MKLLCKLLAATLMVNSAHAAPQPPLFKAYPKLQETIPHVTLGIYPTPLIREKKLASDLRIRDLYFKDDGVNGLVDKAKAKHPGGNKNRKLEFLLAHAKAKGFSTIVTVGSAGSNHACETAHCAQLLGLKSILVLNDQPGTSYTKRNLKLDVLFDAEIHYVKTDDDEELTKKARLIAAQKHAYFIPMGGSSERGTLGFVNAMFELRKQIHKKEMPEPDVLYVTLGSAGTAAGIIIGAKLAGFKCQITPVRISYTSAFKTNLLIELIKQTEKYLHQIDPSIPYQPVPENVKTLKQQMQYLQKEYNTFIEHGYAGKNYAEITKEAAEAIDLVAKRANIKLEGTYTGKTAAALVKNALYERKHRKQVVLFWNTFSHGSFQDLTTRVPLDEIKNKLPSELHHYLTDSLQKLDRGI